MVRLRLPAVTLALGTLALVWPIGSGAASAGTLPRVIPCSGIGRPQLKPGSFILACADANSYVTHIRWSSWTAGSAHGHGTLTMNTCQPNCVHGTFTSSPTTITLSVPVDTARYGPLFSVAVVGSRSFSLRPLNGAGS
jgi:hypothetical protein